MKTNEIPFFFRHVFLSGVVLLAIQTPMVLSADPSADQAVASFNPGSLVLQTQVPVAPSSDIPGDSKTYGAKNFFVATAPAFGASTSKEDNTNAIQSAINAASAYGRKGSPGIVVLDGGTFFSGPITLPSNVYLKITSGTTLKALPMNRYPNNPNSGNVKQINFFSSNAAHDFGVFGGGTIDGNGGNGSSDYAVFSADKNSWWGWFLSRASNKDTRFRTVYFTNSSNIILKNLTVQNSPSMHIMVSGSSNILLSYVNIVAPAKSTVPGDGGTSKDSPNTDGFDPGGNNSAPSTNIWVDHCSFDTGDDCVAVKAAGSVNSNTASVSNLFITNSTFKHGHGLSFGGQTTYGIQNVIVDNCVFQGTQYGIKIKSPRGTGGEVKNIQYSNLTMTNVGKPIWFTAYYPDNSTPTSNAADTKAVYAPIGTPYYHNILIQNLKATGASNAGQVFGTPERVFSAIVFKNVSIEAEKGLLVRNAAVYTSTTTISSGVSLQEQAWNSPF